MKHYCYFTVYCRFFWYLKVRLDIQSVNIAENNTLSRSSGLVSITVLSLTTDAGSRRVEVKDALNVVLKTIKAE